MLRTTVAASIIVFVLATTAAAQNTSAPPMTFEQRLKIVLGEMHYSNLFLTAKVEELLAEKARLEEKARVLETQLEQLRKEQTK